MGSRALGAALLAVAIAGAAGMFEVGQKLSDIQGRLHPTAEEEQRRLQVQIRIDAQVDDALAGLAEDTEADRVLVFLAHNGTTDLTAKIPFMYLSNTHGHLRPGTAWREAWSRPVPLAAYSPLLRRVFRDPLHPACVRRGDRDPDMSEIARARMKERGVEVSFICPLFGTAGVAGFVTAEFMHRETAPADDAGMLDRLRGTAGHIHRVMTSP